MEQLEAQICLALRFQDMSMLEIQEKFHDVSGRTIIRKVKNLHKNQKISHDKIYGKGNHKRYFIKEEDTKNNLLMRALQIKGKKYKEIRTPVTQKELDKLITEEIKFYHDEIKIMKTKTLDEKYLMYHIAIMAHCLEWISQLTWAIYSGMLGDSKNKVTLALKNRERYEEFLQKVVFNLKETDPQMMKAIIQSMYHVLLDNHLFSELSWGQNKGKQWLRINKNSKNFNVG